MIDITKLDGIALEGHNYVPGYTSREDHEAEQIGLESLQDFIEDYAEICDDYTDLWLKLRSIAQFPFDLVDYPQFDALAEEYADELAGYGTLDEIAENLELDLHDKDDRYHAAVQYFMDTAGYAAGHAADRILDKLIELEKELSEELDAE